MADKSALTITNVDSGVSICLAAFEFFNVIIVIVADVFAKGGLFVKFGLLPLGAFGVSYIVGAFVPCLQNLHDLVIVLNNHEAGVCIGAVKAIRVVLWRVGIPRILGHYNRVLRLDIPVVHHPLHRYVQETECGIGVQEDDKLVVLDQIG